MLSLDDHKPRFNPKWKSEEITEGPEWPCAYDPPPFDPNHKKKPIVVYTDGSCCTDGIGGYGVVFFERKKDKLIEQLYVIHSDTDTTVNKMELGACIHALQLAQQFYPDRHVQLYTDSTYVETSIRERLGGWVNSGKKKKNQDLWVKALPLINVVPTQYNKVKGHSGDFGNDRADHFAGSGRNIALYCEKNLTLIVKDGKLIS